MTHVKIDGFVVGGRALHRKMHPQAGMLFGAIIHQAGIGENQCIDAQAGGHVHRVTPLFPLVRPRVSIDRQEHTRASTAGVDERPARFVEIEIETGKISSIGSVAEPHINGIRTVIHRGFQRRHAACGTDEFHMFVDRLS